MLKVFAPAASRIDRDRIMFAAGEHAAGHAVEVRPDPPHPATVGRSVLRCWQAAAVLLGCSTLALSWTRFDGQVDPSIAVRPATPSSDETDVPRVRQTDIVANEPESPESDPEAALPIERPQPPVFVRRDRERPEPAERFDLHDGRGYLALRHVALTDGVDALPSTGAAMNASPSALSYGRLRDLVVDPDRS